LPQPSNVSPPSLWRLVTTVSRLPLGLALRSAPVAALALLRQQGLGRRAVWLWRPALGHVSAGPRTAVNCAALRVQQHASVPPHPCCLRRELSHQLRCSVAPGCSGPGAMDTAADVVASQPRRSSRRGAQAAACKHAENSSASGEVVASGRARRGAAAADSPARAAGKAAKQPGRAAEATKATVTATAAAGDADEAPQDSQVATPQAAKRTRKAQAPVAVECKAEPAEAAGPAPGPGPQSPASQRIPKASTPSSRGNSAAARVTPVVSVEEAEALLGTPLLDLGQLTAGVTGMHVWLPGSGSSLPAGLRSPGGRGMWWHSTRARGQCKAGRLGCVGSACRAVLGACTSWHLASAAPAVASHVALQARW
jgi:hypothetical protein